MATSNSRRFHGIKNGYRSGLEDKIASQLRDAGIEVRFEQHRLAYVRPAKPATYTPDFFLPNGIVIETKGRFMTDDRQKHKLIKAEHPLLDIRFVFSRAATKISKVSKTSYADWCEKYGFLWADKVIPDAWLREPECPIRIKAIEEAIKR